MGSAIVTSRFRMSCGSSSPKPRKGARSRRRGAKVIVAVAGMKGALPSVTGGLVQAPVIAVPTSVGYGSSFHGLSALLAMLNSCAAGVAIVNIDNGFGAGYMASTINRLQRQHPEHPAPRK